MENFVERQKHAFGINVTTFHNRNSDTLQYKHCTEQYANRKWFIILVFEILHSIHKMT